jgi:hypothetical protein
MVVEAGKEPVCVMVSFAVVLAVDAGGVPLSLLSPPPPPQAAMVSRVRVIVRERRMYFIVA